MAFLLIRHRVADFESWKRVYDADAGERRKAGLADVQLLRTLEDPNDVVLLFKTDNVARARKRMDSAELRKLMQEAGVVGTPDFAYLDEPTAAQVEAAAEPEQPAIH